MNELSVHDPEQRGSAMTDPRPGPHPAPDEEAPVPDPEHPAPDFPDDPPGKQEPETPDTDDDPPPLPAW
jgi:hypothetical protein